MEWCSANSYSHKLGVVAGLIDGFCNNLAILSFFLVLLCFLFLLGITDKTNLDYRHPETLTTHGLIAAVFAMALGGLCCLDMVKVANLVNEANLFSPNNLAPALQRSLRDTFQFWVLVGAILPWALLTYGYLLWIRLYRR